MSNNLIEAYEVVEGSDVDLKLEVEFGHMAVTDIYLEHVKIVSGKLGNISLSPLMPGSELKGKTLHFSTMVTIYTPSKKAGVEYSLTGGVAPKTWILEEPSPGLRKTLWFTASIFCFVGK